MKGSPSTQQSRRTAARKARQQKAYAAFLKRGGKAARAWNVWGRYGRTGFFHLYMTSKQAIVEWALSKGVVRPLHWRT